MSLINIKQYLNGDVTKYKIIRTSCYVYKMNATGNCQMDVIGYIRILYSQCNEAEQHEILSNIFGEYPKPLYLVDIKQDIVNQTEQLFLKYKYIIHENNPYISSNGSLMNIIIFKKINI